MTFEASNDLDVAPPAGSRLERAAVLIEQHLGAGAVLDIGCWTGGLGRLLSEKINSYVGVDIEPAAMAVEMAKRTVPWGTFFVVPSVETLPFEDNSFDVVAFTEVIEHVPPGREGLVLRELRRVLKPGGSIVLSTPHHNPLTLLDPAWYFGHRHYTRRHILRLAHDCGLKARDFAFTGGIWTAIDTDLLYVYKHVFHRPYGSYRWLHEKTTRESSPSRRSALSTNLWCRLVRED